MPKNKEALKRYRIIHNILRRGGRHKTNRIVEICKNAGVKVSIRTIQKDLEDLAEDTELGFFLPIRKDDNTKTYYYEEIPKSIFPSLELEPEEITALLFYDKTVSQYKEYPIFKEITNAVQKVIDNSNIAPEIKELFEKETLLEIEKHPQIGGVELIADILDAITKKKVIEIEYQRFDDIIKTHKIKPILLKEDKQLWYIIGKNIKYDSLITLALDRIIDVSSTEESFSEVFFDSKEYFKFSFGITVPEEKPIDVIISFKPEQGNYLKTLPIHHSQVVVEDTKKNFIIKVCIIPSYEFYSKILSYGDTATVLSPESIRLEFEKKFINAVNNYKTVI
ncbi:WYL domain-containing protein [Flavobacterium piscinae]|uniref:WYL domain-containing protein n=1 Tax=Flavobacterium piscinae TaxID=2506424 RepID=A0A4Q1KYM4_9FLAO|nr:WYL domain-containing protein [Flavobacterium piscinae]RXR34649.1 WYL domain-containing protein [Flavobacterium piscinae]